MHVVGTDDFALLANTNLVSEPWVRWLDLVTVKVHLGLKKLQNISVIIFLSHTNQLGDFGFLTLWKRLLEPAEAICILAIEMKSIVWLDAGNE